MATNNKLVVVFGGRFQPMHLGHVYVYDHLCQKFGKDNVWLTTSNKQGPDSPLSFKQKQQIASGFFGIPKTKMVQCKIPYVPHELLNRLPDKDFSLILALGKKDKDRLIDSEYFVNLPKNIHNLENAEDKTYVYTTPMFADERNATTIRKQFISRMSDQKKKDLFVKLFGGFDKDIFNTLTKSN